MNDPLNCSEIRALLVLFVGDDLDAAESARVARHLAECGPCRAEQARWMENRSRLATLRETTGRPSQSVWSDVRAELVREGRIGPARRAAPRRLSWAPIVRMAAAAAVVLSVVFFTLRDHPVGPEGPAVSVPSGAQGESVAGPAAPGGAQPPAVQLVTAPLRKATAEDEVLIERAEWLDGPFQRARNGMLNNPALNLAGDELR